MLAGMTAGLLFNMYGLTSTYVSSPVSVEITVTPAPQLPYPAVTVCNLSPVRQSAYAALQAVNNASEARRRRRRRQASVTGNQEILK